ncbi:MAG: glycoside hydrolase family 55 protein, partial [Chromatiales bacterium]|nr:glycoside hydrolase family 55 protein [Chromatiales bacterium]
MSGSKAMASRDGLSGRRMVMGLLMLAASTSLVQASVPKDDLIRQGILPVTLFGATPDDGKDDTAALQKALDAARDRGLVAYFPSGRYLISDTLRLMQPVSRNKKGRWIQDRRRTNALVGSTRGTPPVLKLADNAKGFNNPTKPKPLVWFWAQPRNTDQAGSERPENEQPNISFNQVFKGIDIDLRGIGHAGAVGLQHAGSQGSAIEDVTVWADGAYAGIYNMPGQGGGVYNATVIGGRFGVWADHRSRYPVMAGIRLKGQAEAAIFWKGQSNLTIAGFLMERATPGPVVTLQPGRKPYNRALTLVDGIIRGSGGRAIDNRAGRSLYLKNLYLSGFDEVVESPGRVAIKAVKPNTRVSEYAYTGAGSKALVEGNIQGAGYVISQVEGVPSSPSEETLIKRHLWNTPFPSFEDVDAVSIERYGARPNDGIDDTEAIRTALAKHAKVFVPKGTFTVRKTLRLDPHNHLFGVAKHLSIIQADSAWKAPPGTPIITTTDDAKSEATLSFLLIERPAQRPGLTLLEWRAGRNSVVRDLMGGQYGRPGGVRASPGSSTYAVRGNGGGRWYGLAAEWNRISASTRGGGYRNLMIESTHEPLAMYGLNIERGMSDPQAEIVDSQNVAIYYLKGESLGKLGGSAAVLQVRKSRNISLFGYSGNAHPKDNAVLKLMDSEDVIFANVMPVRPGGGF